MRIPTVRQVINPGRIIRGVGQQAIGVVLFAAIQKFVPWLWARWGLYAITGAMGFWFPATKAILYVTKLDQKINNF